MSGRYILRPNEKGWYLSFQLTEPVSKTSKPLLTKYIRGYFKMKGFTATARVHARHIEMNLVRRKPARRGRSKQ